MWDFKLCIPLSSFATIPPCFSFKWCSFCILSMAVSLIVVVDLTHFLHFHVSKSISTTKLLILSKQVECRGRKHTVHLASAPCIGWRQIWQTLSKLSSGAATFIVIMWLLLYLITYLHWYCGWTLGKALSMMAGAQLVQMGENWALLKHRLTVTVGFPLSIITLKLACHLLFWWLIDYI